MAEFVDGLENATLFGCADEVDVREQFLRRAKQLAKGGLVKFAALTTLAQEMEDEVT